MTLFNNLGKKGGFPKAAFIGFVLTICIAGPAFGETKERESNPVVRMKTNYGTIDIELFKHAAPKTVDNFLGLAQGTKEFTDPKTGQSVKRKFYDGLIFHRVIDRFMIQSGDPLGTGSGGPGYQFEDEISADALGLDDEKAISPEGYPHQWLMIRSQEEFNQYVLGPIFRELGIDSQEKLDEKRSELEQRIQEITLKEVYSSMGYSYTSGLPSYEPKRGYLAMANRGPNTNGSQFFINMTDTPWLKGKHTVFGKVINGMDIVDKIGALETDAGDKPKEEVKIISVRLLNK